MELPTVLQEPNLSPINFNWLMYGSTDGIGKSSFLASVVIGDKQLVIIDPDKSCAALPGYIINVTNWRDALEIKRLLEKDNSNLYGGVGIDNLNVLYDHLFDDFCRREGHPGDKNDMGKTWNKLRREWTGWFRAVKQAVGGLFIATCHSSMIEIRLRNQTFNKYIPAIPGGTPRGTYRQTMEMFDIVGFMTREPKAEMKEQALIPPKDMRQEIIQLQTEDEIVVHFQPSVYYEAKDTSRQLPAKVALPLDWKEDWTTIISHWGKEEK